MLPDRGLYFKKGLNMFLRLLPLAAKLFLIAYMGRFFSLDDIGVYGLISGATLLLTVFLGQKLDFIVMREIVTVSPVRKVLLTRDEAIYFGLNYAVLGVALIFLLVLGAEISFKYLLYIFLLTILEGYGSIFAANMVSLNHQLFANTMILIRTGLWILPALLLAHFDIVYRRVDTILVAWIFGGVLTLLSTAWLWRDWPWQEAFRNRVDWQQIFCRVKKSCLIWMGAIGIASGVYLDRFVVERFLDLEKVGVATLFFSFTNTMVTLMQSGVSAFAYPKLVALYKNADYIAFNKEARHTAFQVALGALGMAIFLALIVPLFAIFFDKEVVNAELYTFTLMLIGTFFRVNAETPYLILFARHEDRPIWLGNILFLVPALGFNLLLVPLCGLSGIGYGAIIAGLFLLLWRGYYARRVMKTHPF